MPERLTSSRLSFSIGAMMTTGAKYWELIADKLSKDGYSWGSVRYRIADGRRIWVLDARKGDGPRHIVHADDLLAGFLELEASIAGVAPCPKSTL
jgi:hypothetical protein